MNIVKFRPVGRDGPITRIKVTQNRRAIEVNAKRCPVQSVGRTRRFMSMKGFVQVSRGVK